jgi:hypothetical protein
MKVTDLKFSNLNSTVATATEAEYKEATGELSTSYMSWNNVDALKYLEKSFEITGPSFSKTMTLASVSGTTGSKTFNKATFKA